MYHPTRQSAHPSHCLPVTSLPNTIEEKAMEITTFTLPRICSTSGPVYYVTKKLKMFSKHAVKPVSDSSHATRNPPPSVAPHLQNAATGSTPSLTSEKSSSSAAA